MIRPYHFSEPFRLSPSLQALDFIRIGPRSQVDLCPTLIRLSSKERDKLVAIVSKGRNKASFIQRAHILLKSGEGKTDKEISAWLYVSEQTIRRTRLRFCEDGLDGALEDKERPQRAGKLNEQQQAYLVALACSNPPSGRERWTVELLTSQLIADGIVSSISAETVRLVLEKTNSSPGE